MLGLILYNGQSAVGGSSDFVSFGLVQGYPEFRFNLGGETAVIRANRTLTFGGQWHTVRLARHRQKGSLTVDGGAPARGLARGRFVGLDLAAPLYLGGWPSGVPANDDTGIANGFVGCVSRLVINGRPQEISPLLVDGVGISDCATCDDSNSSPCANGAVCQEDNSPEGHRCICRPGFSGTRCERIGESCYAGEFIQSIPFTRHVFGQRHSARVTFPGQLVLFSVTTFATSSALANPSLPLQVFPQVVARGDGVGGEHARL